MIGSRQLQGRRSGPALLLASLLLASCGQTATPAANAQAENRADPVPAQSPANQAAPAPAQAQAPASAVATAEPGAAPPGPAKPSPWSKTGYRLVGTEPFWGGTVSQWSVLYQTPEDQKGSRVVVKPQYGASGETYAGMLAGKPFRLTLAKGACSDGMSDKVHAFSARLEVAGETRRGCADPR